ncbi:MAG: histidine kinase [Gammaproteobacteria bacterium]|nr:histidine kinase [Gammaproteobacteria bacterium]
MPAPARVIDECFLPDFCSLRMVFAVVIVAQLFAFILALISIESGSSELWKQTAMISLFVQWCVLSSSGLLCRMRRYLCRVSPLWASLLSYVIVLLVVTLLSEIGFQLLYFDLSLGANHWYFLIRNGTVAALVTGPIMRYFYIQQAWQRNVKAEAQSRLQALQARIRPHFLFNSLNTIASLIPTNPAQAENAIEDLSDLFRVSLREARPFHSLGEEIDLCERYIDIEKLRLGERLTVNWDIQDVPKDALIPPIVLQPLIENAIYHGIETLSAGGAIHIRAGLQNNNLRLQIENPCEQQRAVANGGNHMAQENIRERLTAVYGKTAGLKVEPYADRYVVELHLPYRNKLDEDLDH